MEEILNNILAPIRHLGYTAIMRMLRSNFHRNPYGDRCFRNRRWANIFRYVRYRPLSPMIGYNDGQIHYSTFRGSYVISFDFTGCAMAKFTLGGHTYFCHIYTSSTVGLDCKTIWNDFLRRYSRHITDLVIFKPFTPRMECQIRYCVKSRIISDPNQLSVLGIISRDGSCYSALIDKINLELIPPVAGVAPLYRSYGVIDIEAATRAIDYRYPRVQE